MIFKYQIMIAEMLRFLNRKSCTLNMNYNFFGLIIKIEPNIYYKT